MNEPMARFTLRQLPLPAKLVLTVFLLTVGLGYMSAMVQMHFQHTKGDGQPMPMMEDVVEVFAGKKKYVKVEGQEPPRPVSKLEKLIMGPIKGLPFTSNGSMAPAFFDRCPEYKQALSKGEDKTKLDAEREGERQALKLWINTPDAERRATYDADLFPIPADHAPAPITAKFLTESRAGYKVKSILDERCVCCHGSGGEVEGMPLETYDQIAKYLEVKGSSATPPKEGEWIASDRQISKEKLAQSTHAHLLSFAMLFSLTGIIFAFTSYPGIVRGILGPLVLIAQVADISCWWLARLEGPGPYFAMCIIATGGMVGLGLCAQIVLSSFNMYAWKGKLVLGTVFALGFGVAGLGFETVVKPQLEEEKRQAAERAEAAKPKPTPTPAETPKNGNGEKSDMKTDSKTKMNPMTVLGPSKMEVVFTGKYMEAGPWGSEPGGMIRAFYDKESEYKKAIKDKDADLLKQLTPERDGEHAAFLAWIKAPADVRKKAYMDDKFELPETLRGKPISPDFIVDDKTIKVKSIVEIRCASCHTEGSNAPSFDTFEEMEEFLKPEPLTSGKEMPKTDTKSQRPANVSPFTAGLTITDRRLVSDAWPFAVSNHTRPMFMRASAAPVPWRPSLHPAG